jgi:hypothetical protein
MPRARLKSELAGRRRSDASGDESCNTAPGILASPPAAQFPHFPSSWDSVASELAGALGDACRTSKAPRLLVDLKVQLMRAYYAYDHHSHSKASPTIACRHIVHLHLLLNALLNTQLPQLERTRMQGALEEDESPLLLDLLRGVAQNLAVKGFTRVRVCFNSMPLALAARRLMTMNPFILRLDALGGAGLASDDEMVILIRPNNALNWNKVSLLC